MSDFPLGGAAGMVFMLAASKWFRRQIPRQRQTASTAD